MPARTKDLWSLVRFRPQVDPKDLAEAIREEVSQGDRDYRTRLLIRDSLEALQQHWLVLPQLSKDTLFRRLHETTKYILFGETLPSEG